MMFAHIAYESLHFYQLCFSRRVKQEQKKDALAGYFTQCKKIKISEVLTHSNQFQTGNELHSDHQYAVDIQFCSLH